MWVRHRKLVTKICFPWRMQPCATEICVTYFFSNFKKKWARSRSRRSRRRWGLLEDVGWRRGAARDGGGGGGRQRWWRTGRPPKVVEEEWLMGGCLRRWWRRRRSMYVVEEAI